MYIDSYRYIPLKESLRPRNQGLIGRKNSAAHWQAWGWEAWIPAAMSALPFSVTVVKTRKRRDYMITYIYIYMYTCIHTYMHTYIHTYIHTYMYACMHAYIHTFVFVYIHIYRRVCICIYVCIYVMCVYMYICVYAYTSES